MNWIIICACGSLVTFLFILIASTYYYYNDDNFSFNGKDFWACVGGIILWPLFWLLYFASFIKIKDHDN